MEIKAKCIVCAKGLLAFNSPRAKRYLPLTPFNF